MKNLTVGKPLRVILLFALPLYIGQMFQLCYSLIDTRMIGSFLGESSLGAVGATTSLSDMLIEFLNGIIAGFGIVVSTWYGAKDEEKLKKSIGGLVILGVAAAVVISIVSLLFLPQILGILNVSDSLLPEAAAYIRIILAGMTAHCIISVRQFCAL